MGVAGPRVASLGVVDADGVLPGGVAVAVAVKGLGIFVVQGKGKTQEPPVIFCAPCP